MEETPELSEADPATQDFILQQTMLRIKDPQKSLSFYNRCLGMTLLLKLDFPSMKFSQYVLGYEDRRDAPAEAKERVAWAYSCKATVVLTHNWGSENDEKSFHNGNLEPLGFGKIKGLAFIQDPDGYWIEIFSPDNMASIMA